MKAANFSQLLFVGLALFFTADTVQTETVSTDSTAKPKLEALNARALAQLAKQPLRFEENVGQSKSDAKFLARRSGASLSLADAGATLTLSARDKHAELTLSVAGGRSVKPVASEKLATKTNYLIGRDKTKWHTNVASYAKVTYPEVLDGVDVVYHGEEGQLEYDFVVAPGADVAHVAMNIGGSEALSLTPAGDLAIAVGDGTIVQPKPRVFQRDERGVARDVDASYRLVGQRSIGFVVASYDHARPLVIDPVIGYSTYLGGSGDDQAGGIAADSSGNAFVVGLAASPQTFTPSNTIGASAQPASAPSVGTEAGGMKQVTVPYASGAGGNDIFVAKLASNGALVYYTYVGGSFDDSASGVTIDGQGLPVLSGTTLSYDFPWTNGSQLQGSSDALVVQMNANGDGLAFATSAGPDQPCPSECTPYNDGGNAIAVVGSKAYIVGNAQQQTVEGCPFCEAVSPSSNQAFVSEVTLSSGVAKTQLLGGTGAQGVAADTQFVYVAGQASSSQNINMTPTGPQLTPGTNTAAFLVKLKRDATLSANWGTYYRATSGTTPSAIANAVALGASGHAYITGTASCTTATCVYPTKSAYQTNVAGKGDAFVAQYDTTTTGAASLVYATLLGGATSATDTGTGIAVDALGHAYVSGFTDATDFPTVPQTAQSNTGVDAFVTELETSGASLLFSVKLGGSNTDQGKGVAVNSSGVYVAGDTRSTNFPTVAAYQSTLAGGPNDAFIARLTTPPLAIQPASSNVAANASLVFTASGGSGTGYSYALSSNGSGASVNPGTGAYTAGPNSGTDIVSAYDATGNSASALVVVTATATPPDLVLSPTDGSATPRGNLSFTATGGTPPYFFDFVSNASNGTISDSGFYIAGTRGSVYDTIRVTDQAGVTRTATVRVGPAIAITPNGAAVAAGSTTDFRASGGGNQSYQWSASAGTITSTGSFTAPGSATTATITVRDSFGNTASVNVSVGGALVITPSNPTTYPRGTVHFQALGGSGEGFKWVLVSGSSGGAIDIGSGDYTAGGIANTQDTIEVADSNGNKAAATITIGVGLVISPPSAKASASAQVSFSASGGSGAGFVFSMLSAPSGGSISQQGIYTAGRNGGVDLVKVTDSAGNTAQAQVTAAPAPESTGSSGNTGGGSTSGGSGTGVNIPNVDAGAGTGLNLGVGNSTGDNSSCSVSYPGVTWSGSGAFAGLALGLALIARRRGRKTSELG